MANQKIKNATVPISSLGLLNSDSSGNLSYSIRYRITTEDKTKISAWSPIYDVPYVGVSHRPTIKAVSVSAVITITWTTPVALASIPIFDVFVLEQNSSTYKYAGSVPNTTSANSFTYLQDLTNPVQYVAIQIGTASHAVLPQTTQSLGFLGTAPVTQSAALSISSLDGGTA